MNTKYSISFPFVCWLHWIFQFSRFSDLISDITQAYFPWKATKSKFMNIGKKIIEANWNMNWVLNIQNWDKRNIGLGTFFACFQISQIGLVYTYRYA